MSTLPVYPRIPYGEADIHRILRNGWLYVDKTRFVRRLAIPNQILKRLLYGDPMLKRHLAKTKR